MKNEEKWHSFPAEIPPEEEPLRIEIWNNLLNAYELGAGAVYEGEWCYYDPKFKLKQPFQNSFQIYQGGPTRNSW